MPRLLSLLLLFALAGASAAQNGTEPIVASDLFQIRQLGDVSVAPGGRLVLYTVRQAYREGEGTEAKHGYRTHLWLAAAGGSEAPRPLTRGDQSASQPAWHPDADRIAFVRTVDGKSQIFVLPLDGGEAYQLTRFKHGANSPRWSPDGEKLLFAASLSEKEVREATGEAAPWPSERPGRRDRDYGDARPNPDGSLAEIRAWLHENAEDRNPRVLYRLNLQDERDLEPGLSFRHLYVVGAEEGSEPRAITRGYYSFGGGEWTRDGRRVIVSGNTQREQHPDRVQGSNLYLIDVENGRMETLLAREGRSFFAPQVAPDGATVAFVSTDLNDQGFAQSQLGIFALNGRSEPVLLTERFDRSVGAPRWSPDGRYLYFTAPSNGGFPLFRVAPFGDLGPPDTLAMVSDSLAAPADSVEVEVETGPRIERLTSFERGVGDFDVFRASVYFVGTEVRNPSELYAANLRFTEEKRLTSHNVEWLRNKRLSVPEARTLLRPDSLEVQYWIMRPAFAEPGRTYPLMLQIHGGPSAMWGPGEGSMWHEFQFFASRGYGIVYSNPRGSGGYGHAFQRANYQNWGEGPAGDVLATATEAAKLPWVDREKQVVTGGSYAGYLTAWIIGHDDRFKAAVAQRGVYDLRTFFGEGNAWRLVPNHFGGYPWERDRFVSLGASTDTTAADSISIAALLERESPLTYVANINTPLLIKHGDNDRRTGFVQSEMLYRSLKQLGKPVELVRYPGGTHELSRTGDPKQRMDRLLRIYEFMERYIR